MNRERKTIKSTSFPANKWAVVEPIPGAHIMAVHCEASQSMCPFREAKTERR